MKRSVFRAIAAFGTVGGFAAFAGTDGVWSLAGSGSALWSDTANWAGGLVADGQDAIAHFDAVDVGQMAVSLEGGTRTVGHLIFDDTVSGTGASQWWDLNSGTLALSVSSGISTVEVSNLTGGVGIQCALTGDFRKTGNQTLYLKTMPGGSIDIDEGKILFWMNKDSTDFRTQSISGSGDIQFSGQAAGYYRFQNYSGTLTYTGRTIISLAAGSANWYQGSLWLETDDVLPHATVVELLSGKIYTRKQTGKGLTVSGLAGSAGTFITTDRTASEIQKWTIDVAAGGRYEYAGVIGPDGTGTGKNSISLVKRGNGTQILSGANAFVGALVVSNGTLLVNNATGSGTGLSNMLTVCSGATLGGSGTVLSGTALGEGCGLSPSGALTVTNLAIGEGLLYQWSREPMKDSRVRVLGDVSLPSVATVMVSRTEGAAFPPEQGVLFTWSGVNLGANDLSCWVVAAADGPGIGNGCTYDADNKRVLFNIAYPPGTDGTWNTGGDSSMPENAWADTARWVDGRVAGGYDSVARFDGVDAVYQHINLQGGTQTVGRLVFGDTNPGDNWWSLMNGTLDTGSSSGALTVAVDNVSVYFERSDYKGKVTVNGKLVKTGNGTLYVRDVQPGAAAVCEGTLCYQYQGWHSNVTVAADAALTFGTGRQSIYIDGGTIRIAGEGDVVLNETGYNIYVAGGQLYTGKTVVNSARVYLTSADGFPAGSVLSLGQTGKLTVRDNQRAAGLEGGGTVTTDQANPEKTLTLDVAEGAAYTYAGEIRSALAVTKGGSGTQVLSGTNNTFLGNVAVNAGALLVNNAAGPGAGTNNCVTVAAGATLGGSGILLCTTAAFAASSAIAPGGTGAAGTLTFGGDVTLAEGVTYGADCAAGASDSVTVGGTLTLPAAVSVQVTALDAAALPKRITLFSASALTGATDLSDWAVSGTGDEKYRVIVDETAVVAERIPSGTLIRLL